MATNIINMLLSPAVIISLILTGAAVFYSYIYLPMQMRKAYRQGLLTLAGTVEAKDQGSEGHGERVARYVLDVAVAMRVPGKELRRMEYAAFLQDIGNVNVPHSILNKKGRLTKKEFDILKSHVVQGADMIEQNKFLLDIAPIVRYHHEAWDGSGYPEGLKGEDIPLGARILAVCTAYDSMIHTKSYRIGISEDKVIREIRASSGTRYDPTVVDVFLNVLKHQTRDRGNSN